MPFLLYYSTRPSPPAVIPSQIVSVKEEKMQVSSLSSGHITTLYNNKTKLHFSSQTPHFKPNSPTHPNYNNTPTSTTSLTSRPRNNTSYSQPKLLCGISSNTLTTSDNTGNNSSRSFRNNLISPLITLTSRPKSNTGSLRTALLCGNSSNSLSASDGSGRTFKGWVEVVGEAISTAFPIWVALGCFLGLVRPNSYDWVQPKWTMMGITFTMLGMGMTLTFDDLKEALAMPKELFTGFFLQYSVMPLSAFFVSKVMNLPSYYAAGLILVGCCPGGTASNIVTYIARGNVALSVLMTAASTVSAVVMTPFLTAKLAGQYVAVDAVGLLKSTLQVVLLPVLVGAFMNQYFKGVVKFVSPLMPPIAVATVAVLCGNAIAQSSSAILMSGQQVVLATILLHTSGFCFGYLLPRFIGVDVSSSRTISIEVGMQNSVLGVVLATQHFGNPLTAVPCAVSSVCHSILGSALAGIWRRIQPETQEVKRDP